MTNKKTEEKFERLSDEQKNIIKDMVISLGSLDLSVSKTIYAGIK